MIFPIFLHVHGRTRIRTNNYGSGRPKTLRMLRIRIAQTLRILRSGTHEVRIPIYRQLSLKNNQGQRLLFERWMMGDELYLSECSSGETANPLPGLRHGTGQRFPCSSFLCSSWHQLKAWTVSSDLSNTRRWRFSGLHNLQRANKGRVIK